MVNKYDDQIVKLLPHILTRKLDEQTLILDLKNRIFYGLDSVGSDIWEALIESGSEKLCHDKLLREYEVDSEILRQDINFLMSLWLKKELIDII